jgi:tryptophanyl-tRNA synthetase
MIPEQGARIRAFDDPSRKMSKRESHVRAHAVRLNDEPDEIRAVISQAVTDSGREIVFSDAPEKAGINNLLEIYQLLTGLDRPSIEASFDGKGYGHLKQAVAEAVIEALRPIRDRYRTFMSDPSELDRVLESGAGRAAEVAEPKVQEVKRRVGFIVPSAAR